MPRELAAKDLHAIIRGTARALRSSRDTILDESLPPKLAALSKHLSEGSSAQSGPPYRTRRTPRGTKD